MKLKKGGKPKFTTAPKKAIGKKQSVGHSMGGMFGDVTKKKPEQDTKPPTRAQLKPTSAARNRRLEGVKL